MKTYEMVAIADKDGKEYRISNLFYQKDKGFTNRDGKVWSINAYSGCGDGLNLFIHEDGWEEAVIKMTVSELIEEVERRIKRRVKVIQEEVK